MSAYFLPYFLPWHGSWKICRGTGVEDRCIDRANALAASAKDGTGRDGPMDVWPKELISGRPSTGRPPSQSKAVQGSLDWTEESELMCWGIAQTQGFTSLERPLHITPRPQEFIQGLPSVGNMALLSDKTCSGLPCPECSR